MDTEEKYGGISIPKHMQSCKGKSFFDLAFKKGECRCGVTTVLYSFRL